MHKLNKKAEGESPRVTLRMDAGCMKIVERVARSLKGDKSQAIRAIVQAHGAHDALATVRDQVVRERDEAREALRLAQEALDALRASAPKVVAPEPVSAPATHDLDALKRSAKEAGVSVTEFNSSRYKNDALRARWTALKIPLRAFVARHDITRTPFQKWAACERDMHGETLARYEAAIAAEEAAK